MPLNQFDERIPVIGLPVFGGGYTPGTRVDVFDAGGPTARLDVLMAYSFDSTVHQIDVSLWNGTTNLNLGGVSIPAGDGVGNVSSVTDLLAALLPTGQTFLLVPSGWTVRVADEVAVTDAGVSVYAQGGAF